jgi:hypothetical protein
MKFLWRENNMDNRYTAANVLTNIVDLEQKEKKEAIAEVAKDYYDYTPDCEKVFTDWADSNKAIQIHVCQERINGHVFEKALVVYQGEKLSKKLKALRQLGYTAKLVEML